MEDAPKEGSSGEGSSGESSSGEGSSGGRGRGRRRRGGGGRRGGSGSGGGSGGGGGRNRGRNNSGNSSNRNRDDGYGENDGYDDNAVSADGPPVHLGVLEVLGGGSGFIRRRDAGYVPSQDDIYVGARVINKFGLRTGDELSGETGNRPKSGKSAPLTHLREVNGRPPEDAKERPDFDRLSAMHPEKQLRLECGRTIGGKPDYTNRVIDLFCPLGKGQRAMIVAPAKAGKTTVMQSIAEGVATNHPECTLFILLVDERPEEVTEMETIGFGEVISSTFDRTPDRHCQVAEITLERARRRVEMGEDVVIILDSITRMARAYNSVEKGTGRTLSGGLDSGTMEKPKRFLGSARKIASDQGGGSLTIIATALVDTGSRMDQVIFEEFKGTGNSELLLSRDLADRRIYPAIDLNGSSTRKEELLLDDDELDLSRALRRQLSGIGSADSMTELLNVMNRMPTNKDLVDYYKQRSSS